MATTKTKPRLDLFELILDETVEVCQEIERLRERLRHHRRGSEAYSDVRVDAAVAGMVMNVKAGSLLRERKAILDAMRDGE